MPTLLPGDPVLVNRTTYERRLVRRGDEVVVRVRSTPGETWAKRVLDSEAEDVLVTRQRQERYRMLAVQRFNDWNGRWFASVPECIASIVEADRQRHESHRRWWIDNTPPGGKIPAYYRSPTMTH